VLTENKDINLSGGNYFSRISYTAEQSGTYYVEVGGEYNGKRNS